MTSPITVTAARVRVSTASTTSGAQVGMRIYKIDNSKVVNPSWALMTVSLVSGGDLGNVSVTTTGAKTITGLSVNLDPGWYMIGWQGDGSASQSTLSMVTGHPITGYWAMNDDGVNWESQGYYQFYTSDTFSDGPLSTFQPTESGSTTSTRYPIGLKWIARLV